MRRYSAGRLTEAIEHFQKPRGEFTVVVAGADN